MRFATISLLLIALAHPASATGLYQCETVEKDAWISETELTAKLEADGWQVRRMKVDGGCWEVYGTMSDGKRVEGYFHPQTGDVLLINQRGKILFRADS